MEEHRIGLDIRDLQLQLRLGCEGRRLVLHDGKAPVDTWIRGDSAEFLCLAQRREDPDTLFFQRRLLIEGNTELGLGIKNLLDSIDWNELPQGFRWGLKLADRISPATAG
ncbi:ubiquinone anaerobic biosynthesis accessory factor UbiT [Marinobacterium aestuariivivens]|uniref:SCP2 domain-containing protein n=1 Tax=Marinobacterium aestuariivivens TaxID=1698799 RepID=A0ABW2A3G8_9GAMM